MKFYDTYHNQGICDQTYKINKTENQKSGFEAPFGIVLIELG